MAIPKGELLLTEAEEYFDQTVKARRWQGRKTYETGLEHRDGRYDWNRMALEEALDLAQYLAAQNRRLEEQLTAARAEIDRLRAEFGPMDSHLIGL